MQVLLHSCNHFGKKLRRQEREWVPSSLHGEWRRIEGVTGATKYWVQREWWHGEEVGAREVEKFHTGKWTNKWAEGESIASWCFVGLGRADCYWKRQTVLFICVCEFQSRSWESGHIEWKHGWEHNIDISHYWIYYCVWVTNKLFIQGVRVRQLNYM